MASGFALTFAAAPAGLSEKQADTARIGRQKQAAIGIVVELVRPDCCAAAPGYDAAELSVISCLTQRVHFRQLNSLFVPFSVVRLYHPKTATAHWI